ncbi:MAG: hypothetical protein KBD01_05800 [Acidobacteria bacterium]|nr:hypothetical protein [Acidobacteriota bacterium]
MVRQPSQENLLDELARLVGRPGSVVGEALDNLLQVLLVDLDAETGRALGPYPMTAWQALAPSVPVVRRAWVAAASAGLTTEEVFTALAVIDDHVRRRCGSDAWQRSAEWLPQLAAHTRGVPGSVGRAGAGETTLPPY